jgi:hypothetical protein
MATALTLCAGFALPQAAAAQLAAQGGRAPRAPPGEEPPGDPGGDGSTRYLGEVILNFTQEWPGYDIADGTSTLEEQYETYSAWIAADGGPAPEVLKVDRIDTPMGTTLRHLKYDEIEGDRTMSAVMLSDVGSARIMLYLDTTDTMPLDEMDKMSFEVAMMLRDTCADEISCAAPIPAAALDTE